MLSRLSAILACLLALVVASPLCCCAAKPVAVEDSSCCCGGGDGPEGQGTEHRCPCASNDPREIPDPVLNPPPGSGYSLEAPPASPAPALPGFAAAASERPRWMPSPPWHAPPAERRARLMSRLI